jgi:hypothetical protein
MTHTDWNTDTPGPQPGQPAWQPPAPQPEQKSRGKKLLAIGGPIAAAAVVGVASMTGLFGAGDPEVGDCVKATGTDTWDVVDCDSQEAQWKVVGEDEKQITYPEFQHSSEICSAFPTAEYSLWVGPDGMQGTVYCAEPVS